MQDSEEKIDDCRKQLKMICESINDHSSTYYEEFNNKLNNLIAQEESYQQQREKIFWLRDGDLNTKYFHFFASTQKRMNFISSLTCEDGSLFCDQNDISNVVKKYFQTLLHNNNISFYEYLEVVDHVSYCISSEDNDLLSQPFSIDEFKMMLFQMNFDKPPSPNDLNPAFYKLFWHLCCPEIFSTTTTWHNSGDLPLELNNTNIVLIPKKNPFHYERFWTHLFV